MPRASTVTVTFALLAVFVAPIPAQNRPPVVSSIDLLVPFPPTLIPIRGRSYVVYELHITNFQSGDASIARVQVIPEGQSKGIIADYTGDELRQRLGRPGLSRQHPAPHIIGPGMRAIVYLWIQLPAGADPPSTLVHRVELEVKRSSGPVRTTVESDAASVSAERPVVLDPPLRGGPWVAIYHPLLMGGHRTAVYTIGGRARIPGRFAIDWIRLPPGGALELDPVRRPADWNGYGAEVLAVADSVVAAAMDDIPENPETPVTPRAPMPPENASGNYVALDLGDDRFAFYEHLRRGSIMVKVGDRVKAGEVIGRLGNSGSSSMGPHLHFHVSDANSPLGAEGRPFVFARFEQLGAFRSFDALHSGDKWQAGAGEAAGPRLREHPGANTVVRFP